MTQLWQGDTVVPVTKVEAGPCTVLQLKTVDQDGYTAIQVGYGKKRASLITKPLRGHFKNFGDFRFVREFRVKADEQKDLHVGDIITVKTFAAGDKLTVIGTSKGKGFQGVVRRHGFHGQDATHGNKDQLRMSGSVGAGGVQHVFKGMRMGGRMGGDRVTLHDVEVIAVDETTNSLLIKGAVPGARNGLMLLSASGDLIVGEIEKVEEKPVEETTEEVTETTEAAPVSEETAVEVAEASEPEQVEETTEAVAPAEEPVVEAAPEVVETTEESAPAVAQTEEVSEEAAPVTEETVATEEVASESTEENKA